MQIHILENGMIKEQSIETDKSVLMIYGYNNSGKTSLLKTMDQSFDRKNLIQMVQGREQIPSLYIPANRLVVSSVNTKNWKLDDFEDFLNYKKDMLYEYSLHLKKIREEYYKYEIVKQLLSEQLFKMFQIKIGKFDSRLSDGMENIINLYLNIIWGITFDLDLTGYSYERLLKELKNRKIIVLIDEVEAFLHVSVQSRLLLCLKEVFENSMFIMTTHSPLLLSRYQNMDVFYIKDGALEAMHEDLYYMDLDTVFESWFGVDEFPANIRKDINYLGDVVLGEAEYEKEEISAIIRRIVIHYPNIYKKYHDLMVIAEDRLGIKDGKA